MSRLFWFLMVLFGLSAGLLLPALEKRFGAQHRNQRLVENLIQQGGPEADNLLSLSGKGFTREGKRGPAVQAAFVEQAAFRSGDAQVFMAAAQPFYFRPLFLDEDHPLAVAVTRSGNWTLMPFQLDKGGAVSVELPLGHPAGWVYLSQPYGPGWTARADGNSRSVLRAERAFLAVAVQASDKKLVLRFKPFSFYAGLGISLLTLAFLIWPAGFRRVFRV